MKHSFHCHLAKSFLWYRNWHKHPHHQHAHWSVFAIIALFLFSSVSDKISSFYFENQYIYTAQAQTGPPPYGLRGICPPGYIELGGVNASSVDIANNGFYCDNDPPSASQVTYPVQGLLMCDSLDPNHGAFVTVGYNRCQTWDFSSGRPAYPAGSLIAESNCSINTPSNPLSITIPDSNISIGTYTTTPADQGAVCIIGTETSTQPPPPPPPSPTGNLPYGFPFECPAGYIALTRANASGQDITETPGWFCDEESIFGEYPLPLSLPDRLLNGVTYPVTGFLMCSGDTSGTAFIHDGSYWPCNSNPSATPPRVGWSFSGGRPYKYGQPVQLVAELDCSSGTTLPVTVGSNIQAGAWTTSAGGTRGTVCIPGIDANRPRYLYFAAPDFAPAGAKITLSGDNLAANVEFIDSSGNSTTVTGILSFDGTEVEVILPSNLVRGYYTIRIADSPVSNGIPFEVTPGLATPEPTGTEPPIITSINPTTVSQGGTIEIIGEYLWSDVQFTDINGQSSYATGFLSADYKVVTVTIDLPPGIYNIAVISPSGIGTTPDILTVIESQIPSPPGPTAQAIPPATSFESLISSVFNYAIWLVGIAVFIMILWAGFLWLTSAASPGNIATAKKMISNAILGAILLISAYAILYTINPELVGGNLNLEGIEAPAPLPQPPPGGTTVNPYTGCGTNQQAAQDLLRLLGSGGFSASASCGGNNHAFQNIMDMKDGLCPSVCADQCTPACTPGGASGDITVDPEILEALHFLRSQLGINFIVTSFTTGDHSPTSYHYAGRAVDIVPTIANSQSWSEAKYFLSSREGSAICEINGRAIPNCDDFSSGAHIHWQR